MWILWGSINKAENYDWLLCETKYNVFMIIGWHFKVHLPYLLSLSSVYFSRWRYRHPSVAISRTGKEYIRIFAPGRANEDAISYENRLLISNFH